MKPAKLFTFFVFIIVVLSSETATPVAGAAAVDVESIALTMPMSKVTVDAVATSTLLTMRRHGRRSGSAIRHRNRSYHVARSARSRPVYRTRHRHHRSVYRHHRPWRRYWWGPRWYWGPWPWWGWGYVYPFGAYYYPGWGWWYYPPYGCSYYGWWRCWYFDRWGYWYYPGLHFSAYIASRPERIVYVDNDSDDDLYYAVYYRRRIGDVYYLYRIDEPMMIDGRHAVKVRLPKSKDRDYMIIAEKTEDKLPRRMHHDKSGKLVETSKEDPGRRPTEVEPGVHDKIKVEELSKKDKRALKKMKRKLREKDKKLRELSNKITRIKDPEAEAQKKKLKRVEAVKEKQAAAEADGQLAPRIEVDTD